MYKCGNYPVIEKTAISAGIFSLTVLCPGVAELAQPGQFAHIKVEGFQLRRPISICDFDRRAGTIRLVFEVRGGGTGRLSGLNAGDNLDMIAPLGKGFTLPETIAPDRRLLLVGGGIGVPPLLSVSRRFRESATVILGFRSYDKIILANDFKLFESAVITCTDDGSVGRRGFVVDALVQELEKGDVDGIFACGPTPMLKAVVNAAGSVPVEISLEERMGCGVGACAVCACRIADENGVQTMKRVCKDGPVFDGKAVIFKPYAGGGSLSPILKP